MDIAFTTLSRLTTRCTMHRTSPGITRLSPIANPSTPSDPTQVFVRMQTGEIANALFPDQAEVYLLVDPRSLRDAPNEDVEPEPWAELPLETSFLSATLRQLNGAEPCLSLASAGVNGANHRSLLSSNDSFSSIS